MVDAAVSPARLYRTNLNPKSKSNPKSKPRPLWVGLWMPWWKPSPHFLYGFREAGCILPVTLATFGFSGQGLPVLVAHPAVTAFCRERR